MRLFAIIATYPIGICLTLLSLLGSPRASSVVAITDKAHSRIILAADSLQNVNNKPFGQACKISVTPTCIFAVSGYIANEALNFDLRTLASNACEQRGSLKAKADFLLLSARRPVGDLLRFLKTTDPLAFANLAKESVELASAIFAGAQDGKVNVFSRGFIAHSDGSISVAEWDTLRSNSAFVVLGVNYNIGKYLSSHKTWYRDWLPRGFDNFAKFLIGIAMQEKPDAVGPPVTILELERSPFFTDPDRFSWRWLERGACR